MRIALLCILVMITAMTVNAQPLNNGAALRDTAYQAPDTATVPARDTVSAQSSAKLVVVRRDFTYREQIGIALAMMAFVALMMTTSETFNPR